MKEAGYYDESITNRVVVMVEPYSQQKQIQQVVYRILDANLDRTREGLRIIEEWCRFGLNSAQLAGECKYLRQELVIWHTEELRAARDTPGDPGTDLSHPQEEQRSSIKALLQANFCRVEEALRVLEEYGKLYHPKMGQACKQMRYRVYSLETNLMGYQRHQLLRRSRLYLVTSPSESLLSTVEAALKGGLTLLQYRDKDADDTVRLELATKLRQLCHTYGALFMINDRVDLALAVDADGVHLGQQDMPIAVARQLLGPQRLIGRSTTNADEMQKAIAEGADYIGVGPVYETPTKVGKAAAGLEYVSYAAQNSSVPWFAIGGIDANNINDVIDAGAERVAVVRSLMQAEQPTLVTQYLLSQLNRIKPET
ncbi:thiamine phosphate synthase [Anabaena subtropica]|uniref:Thiamine-phosphate synthase n=1 Tax=Anabaena subtropica FACHB-260 TaxID=2692884 RepID=A0ABR8CJ10_9NOST|nr:thiamine phosphate synthase [Anabaena subtropica]MBD2342761.1 thiamine phosphate synthase [Anabaena subtropica FACHB-260]